jgi:hypothetical protein
LYTTTDPFIWKNSVACGLVENIPVLSGLSSRTAKGIVFPCVNVLDEVPVNYRLVAQIELCSDTYNDNRQVVDNFEVTLRLDEGTSRSCLSIEDKARTGVIASDALQAIATVMASAQITSDMFAVTMQPLMDLVSGPPRSMDIRYMFSNMGETMSIVAPYTSRELVCREFFSDRKERD